MNEPACTRRMKVRRRLPLWIIMAIGIASLAVGCGGGDSGQPGSSGSAETGTQLSIAVTPTDTLNVDCFRNLDCNGDGVTDDPEPFTDHLATATITATTYDIPTQPGTGSGSTIFLEHYTIEYVPENPAAPPLRMREIFNTIVIPAPTNAATPTEMTASVILADLQTKREFREAIAAGNPIIADPSAWPVRYTVVYNFYGENQFGSDVHVRVTTHATFGDFDNCE
jgi:hypothetical protein